MTSHKEASRKLLETILDQMSNISKPQYKFLVTLFTTIPLVRGKMIFRNLSRYRPLSEKTYARQFPQAFDFVEYPRLALAASLPLSATLIAVMDCTFLEKSGNHPSGVDVFYDSTHSTPRSGLECAPLAVVDVDYHTAYTLSIRQTPATARPKSSLRSDCRPVSSRAYKGENERGDIYGTSVFRRDESLESKENKK